MIIKAKNAKPGMLHVGPQGMTRVIGGVYAHPINAGKVCIWFEGNSDQISIWGCFDIEVKA
jgi:hypothetical protein